MLDWFTGAKEDAEFDTDIALPGDGLLITGQSGLLAGTHVASNLGWCKVEALSVGDKVLTFDNAMQTVTDIQRETLWIGEKSHAYPGTLPVLVPKGALYNRCDMWLMPDQGLLIESDAAQDALGDPFAVVTAQSLIGFRNISRKAPGEQMDITILSFEQDEVVYVEGGMLAHCPHPRDFLQDDMFGDDVYDVLSPERGRSLVQHLIETDDARGFVYQSDEVSALA